MSLKIRIKLRHKEGSCSSSFSKERRSIAHDYPFFLAVSAPPFRSSLITPISQNNSNRPLKKSPSLDCWMFSELCMWWNIRRWLPNRGMRNRVGFSPTDPSKEQSPLEDSHTRTANQLAYPSRRNCQICSPAHAADCSCLRACSSSQCQCNDLGESQPNQGLITPVHCLIWAASSRPEEHPGSASKTAGGRELVYSSLLDWFVGINSLIDCCRWRSPWNSVNNCLSWCAFITSNSYHDSHRLGLLLLFIFIL